MDKIEKVELKCNKCGYSWKTKSKLFQVSCPSCGSKIKAREIKSGIEVTKGGVYFPQELFPTDTLVIETEKETPGC